MGRGREGKGPNVRGLWIVLGLGVVNLVDRDLVRESLGDEALLVLAEAAGSEEADRELLGGVAVAVAVGGLVGHVEKVEKKKVEGFFLFYIYIYRIKLFER